MPDELRRNWERAIATTNCVPAADAALDSNPIMLFRTTRSATSTLVACDGANMIPTVSPLTTQLSICTVSAARMFTPMLPPWPLIVSPRRITMSFAPALTVIPSPVNTLMPA